MPNRYLSFLSIVLIAISMIAPSIANAQSRTVPYWATIRTEQLNMRVGPSRQYKIQWVFQRRGLPVKIVRVVEAWRLIEDAEGAQGWVTANLLSSDRGGLVTGQAPAEMRDAPSPGGRLKWMLEPGVVGVLGACTDGWCAFDVRGHTGFVVQSRLFGAQTLTAG